MSTLIFALLLWFIVSNIYVEARNPQLPWWSNPLSRYLHDCKHALVQDAGYAGLVAAMALAAAFLPHGLPFLVCFAIGAFGVAVVVATAMLYGIDWPPRRRVHVIGAGLAFAAVTVGEGFALWHTPSIWFVFAAGAIAFGFMRFAPEKHALEEKFFTAAVIAAFIALVAPPL